MLTCPSLPGPARSVVHPGRGWRSAARVLLSLVLGMLPVGGVDAEVAFSAPERSERAPWRFVVLPDLHNAEIYLQDWPGGGLTDAASRARMIDAHAALYGTIRSQLGGELVMMPGDTTNGEWHTDRLAESFRPQASRAERVHAAAGIVYPALRQAFSAAGYDTILFAVGDHEIGDNPWWFGTSKHAMVPVFKDAVRRHFTDPLRARLPASRFSTPTGTAFEGTSHAVRHRNVVFVSLDQFVHLDTRFDFRTAQLAALMSHGSPRDARSMESVVGTVSGAHLDWFEDVLRAARATPGVDHVIVQGHLPILAPVRGRKSSMMTFEGGARSPAWALMRRYGVDLYIAGEVHATTLIEDAGGPVQLSVRSGRARSVAAVVDVTQDGLRIRHFGLPVDGDRLEQIGTYTRAHGAAASGAGRSGSGRGSLEPVDFGAPILAYDIAAPGTRIRNAGEFGRAYDLVCDGCRVVPGPDGGSALRVAPGAPAILQDAHVSPVFSGNAAGTLSFWMRLADAGAGRRYVITSGDAAHGSGFHLFVQNGRLGARLDRRSTVRFAGPADMADGAWHHVSLRLAPGGKLSGLQARIDGAPAASRFDSLQERLNDGRVRGVPWAAMTFGAAPADIAAGPGGALEIAGLAYWARALSDDDLADLAVRRAALARSAHAPRRADDHAVPAAAR